MVIVIPLWVCAAVCFLIAVALPYQRPVDNAPPRRMNWVALGLFFIALSGAIGPWVGPLIK